MSLKYIVSAGALLALCTGSAAAQQMTCDDLYRQTMRLYQTAPLSAEYSQMAVSYSTSCLSGASIQTNAAPSYPPPAQAYPQYYGQYLPPADEPGYAYDYPGYPYDYDTPVAVGVGFGFDRHFDHDGGFRSGGFHHGAFHVNGGGAFHTGGGASRSGNGHGLGGER